MNIRMKMLVGFSCITLLLAVAGVWTTMNFNHLNSSVHAILEENFASIHATRLMMEQVDQEQNALQLLLLGQWRRGREQLAAADSVFLAQLKLARSNVSLTGEENNIERIEQSYLEWKTVWLQPIVETDREGNLTWYEEEGQPRYQRLRATLLELETVNAEHMFETATLIDARAERAMIPGIISILAAVVFTLMFGYFVTIFITAPITKMTRRLKRARKHGTEFKIRVHTHDEIRDLAEELMKMHNHPGSEES